MSQDRILYTLGIMENPGRQKCLYDPGRKWKVNLRSSETVAASDSRDCSELMNSVSWRH